MLKAFVHKPFSEKYQPTTEPFHVVNSVEMKGAEKYLVMQEVEPKQVSEILSSKKRLDQCDLLCFVYDTSDANSFEYVAALRVKLGLYSGEEHVYSPSKNRKNTRLIMFQQFWWLRNVN